MNAMAQRHHKGFTLIELIIVIVIIAILAAVALPRLLNVEQQAEDSVLMNTLGAIQAAARIAESAAYTKSFTGTGDFTINGANLYFVNSFPAARPANIDNPSSGTFRGIEHLMEINGDVKISYSDNRTLVGRGEVGDDILIAHLNGKCITYQPPQTQGALPNYSADIGLYDSVNNQCN